MNASHALARSFVDEFVRAGMRHACVAPGSRSTPFALALAEEQRVSVHVQIDERSAGFLALGIAKASRAPVAVVCTSGTAATNLHPAVIEASEAGVPLLVLTADRPPELRATGANQTIDQIKLFGGAVRAFHEVGIAETTPDAARYWRSLAARAWSQASSGPVHLNFAFREPLVSDDLDASDVDISGRAHDAPWTVAPAAPAVPREADVDFLVDIVRRTERGLVVAGALEVDPSAVGEFASVAGWPVLAEPTSGARAGAHAVSTYDAVLRVEQFAGTHRPEVVVRFGRGGISKVLSSWLSPELAQVLVDPHGSWPDPERAAARVIAAEPDALLAQAAKVLAPRDGQWARTWSSAEARARKAMDAVLDSIPEPTEPRAARDVSAALPDGATLFVSASMPVRDLDWCMAPRSGLRVIANRGANGIDGSVSTALGVALASKSPTVALLGDLALLHDQNGLLTARHENVDAVLVVLNNDGGGIFSFMPQSELPRHFERLFITPHGLDLSNIAATFDCGYERVLSAAELEPAVISRLDEGGTHIVEVRTDRAENVAIHQRVWRAVRDALA
jgi:2-succinyl-5-enolpyruvyl-6-hydroxy-3-cyclohexene-1-carboxylate synthase